MQTMLEDLFSPRPHHPALHKGSYGRVLVIGGSNAYTGALAFNLLGALRAGADVAVAVAPRRAADVAASFAPDVIAVPYDAAFPDAAAVDLILDRARSADCLVIGGGMERSPGCHAAIRRIVSFTDPLPVVLDAEGILAHKGAFGALRGRRVLLTPHPGELAASGGPGLEGGAESWSDVVRERARRDGVTYVVKADRDVVADAERVDVGDAKDPYTTKGGHGDVLAGVAAAILARGHAWERAREQGAPVPRLDVTPFDAGVAASRLVVEAGRRASARLRDAALASDMLAELAHVVAAIGEPAPYLA